MTLLPPGWSQALAPGEIEGRGPEFPADPVHPPPQDGEEWGAVVLAVQPATCRHAGINGLLSLLVNAAAACLSCRVDLTLVGGAAENCNTNIIHYCY